ncbi:MAG: M23 family metallopeptidase [Oscillospiraceae bacterium]
MCLTQQVLGFAYAAPVQGTVTDGFGWRENTFHYGTDIAADAGTVISSFADGTVTAVGDSSQLGNYVTVSHAGAFTTLYAHCSRITASSGQQVALGDPIAEVGETGNATGPHLHFAIQKDTVYLDPAYYGIG